MAGERADAYAVELACEADGGYVATLPDIGYGATQGDDLTEALEQAADMLEEAVLGLMAHDEEVPRPAPPEGRPTVTLPALTAAKLEAYRAMREAGLSRQQLAERLCWEPAQVDRIFDGRHAVKLDRIEAIVRALGRRLVVTSEAATLDPIRA